MFNRAISLQKSAENVEETIRILNLIIQQRLSTGGETAALISIQSDLCAAWTEIQEKIEAELALTE